MQVSKNRKILLTLVISLMFFVPGSMLTMGTNEDNSENNEMIFYDYISDNELLVYFNMQEILQDQIVNDYGTFTTFDISGEGFLGVLGKPQMPVVTCIIPVPTTIVSYNIENVIIDETISVGKIYPAQAPQIDSAPINDDFVIDEEFYQQDIEYPIIVGKFVDTGKIRDISFVKIEFYPVQYNPNQELATIYEEITIKLSWNEDETVSVESDFYNAPFFNFYSNVFQNWQGFLENTEFVEPLGSRDDGCDYLIISHPDFYSEILELGNWKHSKGIITKVVSTEETGASSSAIKQYIQNAYDAGTPRPSYLLLVGDSEYIPTSASGTDLYYATVDGSDYFPDIFHGRIPADSSEQADLIVQKILTYEQTPPESSEFYNNFAVAAYFQDDEPNGYETRRFVRTSEEIRDYLMTENFVGERIYVTEPYINPTHYNNGYYGDGEPLPEELLRPDFPWDGDADDIINAIETGIFILNHRDHGYEDGWGDPFFDISHVAGLTNGELLPVVYSINCLTGRFDSYECFAESFLRKENGGAVAVFAATRVSYSGYNDWLCRGFYDAQWPDFDTEIGDAIPMYSLGEQLNYGKVYMADTWGDPWGYEDYTFELFHVFGDPTMEIWSKVPENLDVSCVFSGTDLEITVETGRRPVQGALVCVSQEESGFYVKGVTDAGGSIIIDTTGGDIYEEVTLVCSYYNHKTYHDTFLLNQIPEIPSTPDGPTNGKPRTEYTFSTSTVDPDGDQVYYYFSWGDGSNSGWVGPYESGDTASITNSWSDTASYAIKVKAKDENGQETNYSEELRIRISKSRVIINPFLLQLLERFPNAFPLIREILGL